MRRKPTAAGTRRTDRPVPAPQLRRRRIEPVTPCAYECPARSTSFSHSGSDDEGPVGVGQGVQVRHPGHPRDRAVVPRHGSREHRPMPGDRGRRLGDLDPDRHAFRNRPVGARCRHDAQIRLRWTRRRTGHDLGHAIDERPREQRVAARETTRRIRRPRRSCRRNRPTNRGHRPASTRRPCRQSATTRTSRRRPAARREPTPWNRPRQRRQAQPGTSRG